AQSGFDGLSSASLAVSGYCITLRQSTSLYFMRLRTKHAQVCARKSSGDGQPASVLREGSEKRNYSAQLGNPRLGRRHFDVAAKAGGAFAERVVPHSRDSGAGRGGGGCLPIAGCLCTNRICRLGLGRQQPWPVG